MKGGSIDPPNPRRVPVIDRRRKLASMKGGSIDPPNASVGVIFSFVVAGFNEGRVN